MEKSVKKSIKVVYHIVQLISRHWHNHQISLYSQKQFPYVIGKLALIIDLKHLKK